MTWGTLKTNQPIKGNNYTTLQYPPPPPVPSVHSGRWDRRAGRHTTGERRPAHRDQNYAFPPPRPAPSQQLEPTLGHVQNSSSSSTKDCFMYVTGLYFITSFGGNGTNLNRTRTRSIFVTNNNRRTSSFNEKTKLFFLVIFVQLKGRSSMEVQALVPGLWFG